MKTKNVLFVQYPWRGAGDVRLPDGRTFKIDLSPIGFATEYAWFGGIGRKSAVVAALSDSSARVSLLDSHGSEECLHTAT